MKIRVEGRVGKMEMMGFRECHVLQWKSRLQGNWNRKKNVTKDSYCPVYWYLKVLFINFYSTIRKRDPRKHHDGKVRLLPVIAGVW